VKRSNVAKAKRAKKMNPVVRGLLVLALVYIGGTMIATCIRLQAQINQKKAELEETNQQIAAITIENEELNDILNGAVDFEYIEKIARERNYIYPGEIVYENITDK
jgi:cell division protein FtsB